MGDLTEKYPHISFKKKWKLSEATLFELGQCSAIISALKDMPILPEYRSRLLTVSLIKGAQATTAIEGNTLTDEEIENINEGQKLPPSREYQEFEVKNILDAFNLLLREITVAGKDNIITPGLIKKYHRLVGKGLGNHFDAVPGKFRQNNVTVGTYRPPVHSDIQGLIENFCDWSLSYFHYNKGQDFMLSVVQAIVTHAYIAWIHPFGDGNGRTARLLEFYILLRAGNPDFASHLLSNYYNLTRPEYYRQLDKSRKRGDLSDFIAYAVKGYRDGLMDILSIVQNNQFDIYWKNYIQQKFKTGSTKGKTEKILKRRRDLMLEIPIGKDLSIDEIMSLNVTIAATYSQLSKRTLIRDINELIQLGLLKETSKNIYIAHTDLLKKYIPSKRNH